MGYYDRAEIRIFTILHTYYHITTFINTEKYLSSGIRASHTIFEVKRTQISNIEIILRKQNFKVYNSPLLLTQIAMSLLKYCISFKRKDPLDSLCYFNFYVEINRRLKVKQ